jgi:hypothetical protein
MGWRSLFSAKWRKQGESQALDALFKLTVSDAMQNLIARHPEMMDMYSEYLKNGTEGEPYRAGQLMVQLIYRLAEQAGKSLPDSTEAMLEFLKNELRPFDTPQSTDRRKIVTNEIVRGLTGLRMMTQDCEYPGCANADGTGRPLDIANATGEGRPSKIGEPNITIYLCESCDDLRLAGDFAFTTWINERIAEAF